MNAIQSDRRVAIADAIDRFGPDFALWPDSALANEARAAVLADRGLRAYRDEAAALAAGVARAKTALDAEAAASGSAERIRAALMRHLDLQPKRFRWAAVAAVLVVAAGLGGVFDLAVLAPQESAELDVVALDPLVFGMAGDEAQ